MKKGIVKAMNCDGCGIGGYYVDIEAEGKTERYFACWQDESTARTYLFLIRHMWDLVGKNVTFMNAGCDIVSISIAA